MSPLLAHLHGPVFGAVLIAIIVWSLIFKGIALWNAARNHQKRWFIVLLILNTLGILEIIYLIWFRANRAGSTPSLFNEVTPADHG